MENIIFYYNKEVMNYEKQVSDLSTLIIKTKNIIKNIIQNRDTEYYLESNDFITWKNVKYNQNIKISHYVIKKYYPNNIYFLSNICCICTTNTNTPRIYVLTNNIQTQTQNQTQTQTQTQTQSHNCNHIYTYQKLTEQELIKVYECMSV